MKLFKIISFLFLGLFAISCFRIEEYPPEPQIELIEFVFVDTVDGMENGNRVFNGTLRFSFIDGDGDIGFDTTSPQQNTIFLEKYKYNNGVLSIVDLNIDPHYYVPYFNPEGPNKTLKGEMIIYDIDEYPPFDGDTILYKFFIVDRAGNVSNIESTGNLILK